MDIIKFQSSGTQSARQQMQQLKQRWDAVDCKSPESAEAMGNSFREIQKIGEAYEQLHKVVSEMLENTSCFLQNTEEAFVGADEQMAEKIGG